MEISNLSDAEFKSLVIRMLKELSEDLRAQKKIQSEMKEALGEMKNNLKETTVEWMKLENQINDLEHKEAKNTTNQNNKKKKESTKMKIV